MRAERTGLNPGASSTDLPDEQRVCSQIFSMLSAVNGASVKGFAAPQARSLARSSNLVPTK